MLPRIKYMSEPQHPVPAIPDSVELPELSHLSSLQRRFVFAVATSPGTDHTSILKQLDPTLAHHSARVKAWRWMHMPKVQQALLALVPGGTIAMFPVVLKGLHDIAENPQHKDHAKVLMKLHEWYAPRHTESTLNVNVTGIDMTRTQLLQSVQSKIAELGPVGAKVLEAVSANKPEAVDAEFEVVEDWQEGLEDIL
jgi:hypothetical protein